MAIQACLTEKTFADSLDAVEELAGSLDLRDRLTCLCVLIAPPLGRLEQENEPLGDDSPLSTPEAVEGVRRAAAGEPVDVDAVYEQLTAVGFVYSENRDPDSHVIAQTAFAAAIWLRLLTDRDLRSTTMDDLEGAISSFAPSTFTQLVCLLAWTRSGQIFTPREDAAADPDRYGLPAATRELEAMRLEIAQFARSLEQIRSDG